MRLAACVADGGLAACSQFDFDVANTPAGLDLAFGTTMAIVVSPAALLTGSMHWPMTMLWLLGNRARWRARGMMHSEQSNDSAE